MPENVRRFLVDHSVVYQREQTGRDRGPGFGARGDLKILPDRTLLAELKAFQAGRLPSGLLRVCGPAWDEEHPEKAKASRKLRKK